MKSGVALGGHRPVPSQRHPINIRRQDEQTTLQKINYNGPTTPHPYRPCKWLPRYATYSIHLIKPDLDAVPMGVFKITFHPTSLDPALLHAPDERLISPIMKARLHKLTNMYHPQESTTTFPKALADVILRHNATTYRETFTNER